jgi:hypothetical protein
MMAVHFWKTDPEMKVFSEIGNQTDQSVVKDDVSEYRAGN